MAYSVDVAVIGGGLAGTVLAAALGRRGLEVALVERGDAPGPVEGGGDPGRVIALGEGSRRILEEIRIWEAVAHQGAPITAIEVTESDRRGRVCLEAGEANVAALGQVICNRVLRKAAWDSALESARVTPLTRSAMTHLERTQAGVDVGLDRAGATEAVQASLVVGADSELSAVRQECDIPTRGRHHNRYALLATVETELEPEGQAFERFLPEGPLAFLPLGDRRVSIVWTLTPTAAADVAAMADTDFLRYLGQRFGPALGRLLSAGERLCYPLELVLARRPVARRAALIGNAAHLLHPVAGQGFNLAVRDIAALSEEVGASWRRGWDPGSPLVLAGYQSRRWVDTGRMVGATEGLVGIFGQEWPPAVALRQAGLRLMGGSPLLKRALMRGAMGLDTGFGTGSKPPAREKRR